MKKKIIAVCLLITIGLSGCIAEENINNNAIGAEADYQSSDASQNDESAQATAKEIQKTKSVTVRDEHTSKGAEEIETAETETGTDEKASVETNTENREILITKEENEQLEYWVREYQLSPKGLEEDLLQLRGNLELDMDEACYPELRESLERYCEQLQQYNDTDSYKVIVHRADKNVLSFLELQSDSDSCVGYNFDTASGKKLEIYDVVYDMDAFSPIVAAQLQKNYPNTRFEDNLTNKIKETLKQPENFAWIIEYQGISCFFATEALGCDTNEILQVMIPFKEISEIITEQYQQVPEVYAIELNERIPFLYDLNEDGSLDKISIYRYFNDEDKSTEVKVNEQTCVGEYAYPTVYGDNSRAYLVHMEGNTNYLIFYEEGDWDCSGEYAVYTAENNRIEYIGCESIYLEDVRITNPGIIKIKNSTEPLLTGILQTEAYGFVTESGFLQADHLDYYYLDSNKIVKTLVPLSVSLADPYTSEMIDEEINLPAGSYMKLLRTDLETWCDFVLADGQVCRIVFDESESDMIPMHNGQKVLGECLYIDIRENEEQAIEQEETQEEKLWERKETDEEQVAAKYANNGTIEVVMERIDKSVYDEQGRVIATIYYDKPVISGNTEAVARMNSFFENEVQSFIGNGESQYVSENEYEAFLEDIEFMKERYGIDSLAEHPITYVMNSRISYLDENILSIMQIRKYSAEHTAFFHLGYTFDLSTGEVMPVTDMVDITPEEMRKIFDNIMIDDEYKPYEELKGNNFIVTIDSRVYDMKYQYIYDGKYCYLIESSGGGTYIWCELLIRLEENMEDVAVFTCSTDLNGGDKIRWQKVR